MYYSRTNKELKLISNNNFLFLFNKFKLRAASIFLIFTSVLFFLKDSKNDDV